MTLCSVDESVKPILGFLDQCSPQTTANTQRLWSFGKPRKKKNTTKIRANTFGFYSINGQSVVDFKENSKQESVCEFLSLIRQKNPEKEIVLILDNFRSHWAKKTRKHAKDLGIQLVFLPPYSPDLNPIEYIWKSIKRVLSTLLIESSDHLKHIVKEVFEKLSRKLSFAKGWIEQFDIEL